MNALVEKMSRLTPEKRALLARRLPPLSFSQQRLWFLDQMEPGRSLHNVPTAIRLTGSLDVSALRRALDEIVRRQETLRTTFAVIEERPVQLVMPAAETTLPILDLSELSAEEREFEVKRNVREEALRPFDLSTGPLLRVSLLYLGGDEHVLLLTMHHIICDRWSIGILINEMSALYHAFAAGRPSPLAELPIQYADYARWQREWLAGEVLENQLAYWRAQLGGALPVLELPTDRPRPSVQSFRGAHEHISLPQDLTTELRNLSREHSCTLYMTLLAAFQTLLYRYTEQEDILVGTPVSGRSRSETENLIGIFINTLVMRTDLSGEPTFAQLLERVREVALAAYAHQDVPFEKLVEELQPERDLGRSPLFQVMFVLQNTPAPAGNSLNSTGLKLSRLKDEAATSMFDLTITLADTTHSLSGAIEYSTDLFDVVTIKRLAGHFQNLLRALVKDPHQPVTKAKFLSEEEREQLLTQWNQTSADFPSHLCAHQLFELQALNSPLATALIFEDQFLSYSELNIRANQLAHHLRSLGVGPETLVGICVERSIEMVVGLLAILKAGAAYVPLDPSYPQERVRFMMDDSQVRVLLTQHHLLSLLPQHSAHLIALDALPPSFSELSTDNPSPLARPHHLAYVIYTSGSTGTPKAVLSPHRNLVNLLSFSLRSFAFSPADRLPALASFAFDISLFEIFSPLLSGGILQLCSSDHVLDLPRLLQTLSHCTVLHSVPSLMRQIIHELRQRAMRLGEAPTLYLGGLRQLFIGGDGVAPSLLSEMRELFPQARIDVLYGPTEATIFCTSHEADGRERGRQQIGRPISNVRVRVCDRRGELVGVGIKGELYIGGEAVTRGYLRRSEETERGYVEVEGERYYRSGDMVRYGEEGEIEYVGRIDEQVKVRGYRIELGEIEAVLERHERVKEAVVVVRRDGQGEGARGAGGGGREAGGEVKLVGYVVVEAGREKAGASEGEEGEGEEVTGAEEVSEESATGVSGRELRKYLEQRLPGYMIPSAIVVMAQMPLTPNGKVNRKALPEPEAERVSDEEYAAPQTAIEEMVEGIWSEVLKRERVGRTENFFEMGGHSLLATQVISRVREAFNLEVPLRNLFEHPTVEGLAGNIEQMMRGERGQRAPKLERVSREREIPLSFAQARLWFLDQLELGSAFYNVPVAVRLEGELNISALEQSMSEIVRRHEALRTTFTSHDGEPVQVIHPPHSWSIPLQDLTQLPDQEREQIAREATNAEAQEPFNLTTGPLLRARLLKLGEKEHIVLLTMHHIISDGWSMDVLINEISTLYRSFSAGEASRLPELPIQYADYAIWQREWLQGDVLAAELSYWREQLGGELAVLELPTDRPRPPLQSFRGAHQSFTLSESLSQSLRELSQREGCTLYMTLLAAFQTLLHRYSGQDEIVVGSPIAGRNRAQIEPLIGLFINTLVMRTDLSGEPTFVELMKRVREVALGAYAHQDVPFEKLVEELQPARDLSRSPLFQVMFNLLGTRDAATIPVSAVRGTGRAMLSMSSVDSGMTTTKFDLTLSLADGGPMLSGALEFNTDLFDASTIEQMLSHFVTLLSRITENPQESIGQLQLLNKTEMDEMVFQWNETSAPFPSNLCLHHLFELQALNSPLSTALIFEDQLLSYAQLNERANQLAHHLRSLGVGPETLVGICVERSLEMVVGLLAILKAGGAYLPLDPSYPQERLRFMMDDSQVTVLLTQQHLLSLLPQHSAHLIALDALPPSFSDLPVDNPRVSVLPDNLAYVIYTSGSTGTPKAVLVSHHNAVHSTSARFSFYPPSLSCFLLLSSFSFDSSVAGIFWSLAGGAALLLVPEGAHHDLFYLRRALLAHRVSHLLCLASLYRLLLEEQSAAEKAGQAQPLASLNTVIVAGEACTAELVDLHYERMPGALLYNEYGPTEASVWSTVYLCRGGEGSVSIGRPIANMRAYVLDERGEMVARGVRGELYLGGAGITRGYQGRAVQTAERYVPDRWSGESGGRLYRTGDISWWRSDGALMYGGRVDEQVKVRGYRIEMGEIEGMLERHERVREAVVVAKDVGGEKRIVCYVVRREGRAGDERVGEAEVREYLRERLPKYMMPSRIEMREEIARGANGKVDRKALAQEKEEEEGGGGARGEERREESAVEEMVRGIWKEVLKIERVGREENFFERGGHSLLATQLISRLREAFGLEMPLRTLFEHPTVASLSASIEAALQVDHGLTTPPIKVTSRGKHIPLSFAQQRLWFLDQLEPGNSSYNLHSSMRLQGEFSVSALEQTLSELVRRHEVLRTTFVSLDGEPLQIISTAWEMSLPIEDISALSGEEREARAKELINAEAGEPFDLSQGPLLRAKLLRLSEADHIIMLTMHHIISDGWSMGLLVKEITSLYRSFILGEPSSLPELEIQYADYAVWQREWLQGDVLAAELSYWRKQLGGELAVLELPTDRPRPPVETHAGAYVPVKLPDDLTQSLRQLSRRRGVTLYMTLLAAFQTLLSRYSGQEDIIVGSPIAGRNREEIEPLIGFFVNTLVMRTDVSGEPTFTELLKRVREVALGAYAHQDVPFEKLVEELQPERDLSRTPLFQVDFTFQHIPSVTVDDSPELKMFPVGSERRAAKFDLTLSLAEMGDSINGTLEFNTDIFDASTIHRFVSHFLNLLSAVVSFPELPITRLPLLSHDERQHLLELSRESEVVETRQACLHQLFEAQVQHAPDSVALTFQHEHLSYAQLNERANQLAHHLCSLGVGPETLVGICVERSLEMVVGLLAILKAGAAYVPLDPSYPQERLRFMMDDSHVTVLLTQHHLLSLLPQHSAHVIALDALPPSLSGLSTDNPSPLAVPDNAAYVIYTSGSTGTPKGVLVSHHNVSRLFSSTEALFQFTSRDVWTMFHSFAFDFSVWEVWGALRYGGRLVVVPYWVSRSAEAFYEIVKAEGVTVLNQTPSAFRQLMAVDERESVKLEAVERESASAKELALRMVVFGGEALEPRSLRGWSSRHDDHTVQLINMYGITETTVHVTYRRLMSDEIAAGVGSLIGKAIGDMRVYVLDGAGEIAPVGVRGEMYVGGAGVSRGYQSRAELTAQRYVPDGWSERAGERLYRTGDVGRYRESGEIEYLGRMDEQVKVRGYRIELGEIESVLMTHERVREALVLLSDVGGDKRLLAYLVVEPELTTSSSSRELTQYLRERLPEYMIPGGFLFLEQMPLTVHGKIDRRALPQPQMQGGGGEDGENRGPQTAIEEMVSDIWREVLKVEGVRREGNFFELGGHSLLATQVISRVREIFDVDVPLRSLFEHPTVAEMAEVVRRALRAAAGREAPPINRRPVGTSIPLSYGQQRLWFLDQMEPGSGVYNIPLAVLMKGELQVEALERTLNEVKRRHEVLRTRFRSEGGEAEQVIEEWEEEQIEVEEVEGEGEEERRVKVREMVEEEGRRGFDLGRGPMVRVRVLRVSEAEHVVMMTMHHIVSDGWSLGVLINEIAMLYRAYAANEEPVPGELEIQYADYAVWQRDWLQGEVLEGELAYWRKRLGGTLPTLNLPTDRPRPAVPSYRGAYQGFQLPEELSGNLKRLSRREGCTLFMTLLAGFKTLLSRYSGQDDIIVGSIIAGRNQAQIEPLIGLFINTLAMRTDLSGDPSFKTLLARVKEATLGAYAHQDVPFEKLVEELQPERDLSRAPLFQVTFGVQNAPTGTLELPGLSLQKLNTSEGAVRYDLTLWVYETPRGLVISWSYSTELFDLSTIVRMQENFETLLHSIVENPEAQLSALEILSEAEKQKQQEKEQELAKASYKKFMGIKPKAVSVVRPQSPQLGVQPAQTVKEQRGPAQEDAHKDSQDDSEAVTSEV